MHVLHYVLCRLYILLPGAGLIYLIILLNNIYKPGKNFSAFWAIRSTSSWRAIRDS